MSNQAQSPKDKKQYDLIERTAKFGENIIGFVRGLTNDFVNKSLASQLVRSSTSIGANYMEADVAESRKDFFHKIGICRKESKETLHWLRMIAKSEPSRQAECRKFWQEAKELTLIFSSIAQKK